MLPGALPGDRVERLAAVYDAAVASADPADMRVGRTTTRVDGLMSRSAAFDGLYVYPPLLEACCRVIGRPFKLSSLRARTLRPGAVAQELHVDVQRESDDWPLVGFILMVDAFRADNGATRFVRGSHRWLERPGDAPLSDRVVSEIPACEPAGSLLVFNGSAWHGHSANASAKPRRSIQGAFIPREGNATAGWRVRLKPETLTRMSALARYIMAA